MRRKWLLAVLSFLAANAKAFAGPVVSLDLTTPPSAAAYQSFTDAAQVLGFEKGFVYVKTNGNEVLHIGFNAGVRVNDNLAPFGTPLGGPTLHVPGSVLDWALGTKWGDAWLPKLKTGLFAGYNIFRPETIKIKPNFAGFGVTYPVF